MHPPHTVSAAVLPRFAALLRTVALCCAIMLATPAAAQVLAGPWVHESQQRIEQHRMSDLRVIVLDRRGQPAGGAEVSVRQTRHAFPWGFWLDPQSPPPALVGQDVPPVWRCFSAASLEAATRWPDVQPDPDAHDRTKLGEALAWAQRNDVPTLRYGAVLSADSGRLPPWVVGLPPSELHRAMLGRVRDVLANSPHTVSDFDVVTHLTDHRYLVDRLGPAGVRTLYEAAHAARPGAHLDLRVDEALFGERLHAAVRQHVAMRDQFVPVDRIAITQRLGATVLQAPLARSLEWVEAVQAGVVVAGLEVAGPSPEAAAVNLETTLRVLFASPSVRGVYFTGVTPPQCGDPNAALVDDRGRPTAAGRVFDGLVRGLWWTDHTQNADELGAVMLRVFGGWHELSAELPDGSVARTRLFIEPGGKAERVVALQPVRE